MNIELLAKQYNVSAHIVQAIYDNIKDKLIEEVAEVAQDAAAKQRILDHYKLGRIKKLQYLKQQILQGLQRD